MSKRIILSFILVALAGVLLLGNALLTGGIGARLALRAELNNWRAGEPSDALDREVFGSRRSSPPILIEYEIIKGERREVGWHEYTVNLTFTTRAGGRPVEQHRFRLRKEGLFSGWDIESPYRY